MAAGAGFASGKAAEGVMAARWTDESICGLHRLIMEHLEAPDWYYACVVLSDLASLPFERVCAAVMDEEELA